MRKSHKAFRIILCLLLLYVSIFPLQRSRDYWLKPEKVMDVIGVKPGMIIGEAGAGRGYFTFKLSHRVGDSGRVYANDIKEKVLQVIRDRCKREGITNITTILGEVEDPLFPTGKLDMVIMVMAFHDFEKPVEWLENVKPSMKPEATLVIIEKDLDRWGKGRNHFMTKNEILETVAKADFELVRIETFLARDNIYIFRQKQNQADKPSLNLDCSRDKENII